MHTFVDTASIKVAEHNAIEAGISQERLIQTVGHSIAAHPQFTHLLTHKGPILLLVGKGLNGLDCIALGNQLLKQSKSVFACLLSGRKKTSLADQFFEEFFSNGGRIIEKEDIATKPWALIIDGLLGTGGKPVKETEISFIIKQANLCLAPIVSIDLPSGIDADSGEVGEIAIFADITFACQAPKIGTIFQKAPEYVGTLSIVDIGLKIEANNLCLLTTCDAANALPCLEKMAHKYSKGTVHIIAGSSNMMGAASLAASAAFASGSGYVRSFLPQTALSTSTLLPIESVRSFYDPQDLSSVALPQKGAVVVGPGLGNGQAQKNLVNFLIENISLPTVIDGDALTSLSDTFLSIKKTTPTIVTPHRKEAEHLFGFSCDQLSLSLIQKLQTIAEQSNIHIILKGAPTVIIHPSGKIEVMNLGIPALATAGSGDILSGILGSLLAQGLSCQDACHLGTIIHALCGIKAAEELSCYCVRASDILKYIPEAYKDLLSLRNIWFERYLPLRLRNSHV